MSSTALTFEIDSAAVPRAKEIFTDGPNRIVSIQIPLDEFLAHEDSHMGDFVALYQEKCEGGLPPLSEAIPPEQIYKSGMISRTHCLRVSQTEGEFRYAVWAEDANFDGFRSLQNMPINEGTPYPILAKTVQAQISSVLVQNCAACFEVRGVINDHYYYFTKAILPLRNEQGEIVKCFVPFTDKLPNIPPDLREEFCARAFE